MKLIVGCYRRQWALLLSGLALAVTGLAQSNDKPELIEREKEIEMALSAAPAHLRNTAAVYVLKRGGYVKAREGSNGFTCLVEREGVKDTAPICFDREGSETTLLMVLRKMQLIEQGKENKEVERLIEEAYRDGKLLAPRKQGVAYMLSTEFKTHDHKSGKMVTVFPPHVMFYAPYMKSSDIGGRPEHRGSESQPWILNEGKPWAYIIVVPKEK
ncbi:MAG: hypothetical protein AABO41_18870 [Acidobacteriota bacterium]